MNLAALIVSAVGLIAVVLALTNYIRHFPETERIGVIALALAGTTLVVMIVIHVSAAEQTADRDEQLCLAARENRIALRSVIENLETLTDHHSISHGLEASERVIAPAVRC